MLGSVPTTPPPRLGTPPLPAPMIGPAVLGAGRSPLCECAFDGFVAFTVADGVAVLSVCTDRPLPLLLRPLLGEEPPALACDRFGGEGDELTAACDGGRAKMRG